ncbi:uncharacterized protein BXZ73DRAFT_77527 [Epithele typhae]|uniref:uncharacterized protein n=1 Tax=Epithele typhae TaxID=378194 RepID=UPI002008CD72|nr:uncharacterized protein BXZ73DRAFT_77527 [Epithele typhae]KAH9931999.1 hypothetical protein BXZ73DRAFT_77527 [Epithele typhae]
MLYPTPSSWCAVFPHAAHLLFPPSACMRHRWTACCRSPLVPAMSTTTPIDRFKTQHTYQFEHNDVVLDNGSWVISPSAPTTLSPENGSRRTLQCFSAMGREWWLLDECGMSEPGLLVDSVDDLRYWKHMRRTNATSRASLQLPAERTARCKKSSYESGFSGFQAVSPKRNRLKPSETSRLEDDRADRWTISEMWLRGF